MKPFQFLTVISTILFSTCLGKMNVPRVLLPLFRDFTTNFTLELTEPGCYTWSTIRPDIVRLQCTAEEPESGCCSRVVLSSAIKELRRSKETVVAEDNHTGLVWRCDVILDIIRNLTIVTSTRELFLEEAPEAFEVVAYDDQGNVFSTLDGVEFEWSIKTLGAQNKSGESTVVRYITFEESPYESPKLIETLEKQGLKGHIILLEGKQTGTAAITAKLPQSEYSDVAVAGVQLLVRTNLMIVPSDVTLLVDDRIKFRLQQFHQDRVTDIPFPSVQYHLISKSKHVEVDRATGIARGISLGQAEIVLVDNNVAKSDVKPPTASVLVAQPAELSLELLPQNKWSVVVGNVYGIETMLLDSSRRRFHIGDRIRMQITLNAAFFRVDWRSSNGSYLIGTPLKYGKVRVRGEYFGGNLDRSLLVAEEELSIYEPILTSPAFILIPWDPVIKAKYEVQLTAAGGDGSYIWSSSKSTTAVVTQKGLVKTLEGGSTNITASMASNSNIRGFSTVRVEPPARLQILDLDLDAEINVPIQLHIVLHGISQHPFHICDKLPFNISISESSNFELRGIFPSNVNNACATVSIVAANPGTSYVTVHYGKLEANVVVSAYRPLYLLNPTSGASVLALGTSRLIVFAGGPRSWSLRPSEHDYNLIYSDPDHSIKVQEYSRPGGSFQKDLYVYRVHCEDFAEEIITLKLVANFVGSLNGPIINKASAKIICTEPKHLILSAPLRKRCPVSAEETFALSDREFDIELTVTDRNGQKVENISTLGFHWNVPEKRLAERTGIRETPIEEEDLLFPGYFYKTFIPYGQTGVFKILGSINSMDLMENLNIEAALNVILVNQTRVVPDHCQIHERSSQMQNLTVSQGSGYFDYQLQSDLVKSLRDSNKIRLLPMSVGKTALSVTDLCLDSPPVVVNIQVFNIGSIEIDMTDRVEKGKAVFAKVLLFDQEGQRLHPLSKIDLQVSTSSPDISVVETNEPLQYKVTGHQLGHHFLKVFSDDAISLPAPIFVFSPIQVQPSNITLYVGASIQVTVIDGPPDGHLEFVIKDSGIAKVSPDGAVRGLHVGSSDLIVRAISSQKDTGEKLIDSEGRVKVNVVPLRAVTIHVPLTRIIAGGKMPVWAVGSPGLKQPLSVTTAKFIWTLSHQSFADLVNPFHNLGVRLPDNELTVMNFVAFKPGRVTVSLATLVPGQLTNSLQPTEEFIDSVTIEILPPLTLASPRPMNLDYLLMSPESAITLRTTSQSKSFSTSLLAGKTTDLKITSDGVVSAGKTVGTAVISVGDSSNQRRHLTVYVKPVEYVMLNVEANWRMTEEAASSLPLDLAFTVTVTYHDDIGKTFDAVKSSAHLELDQKGAATFTPTPSNLTYTLHLHATTPLRLHIRDDQHSAYLHLHATDLLHPPASVNRITQGDVLCLRLPVDVEDEWRAEGKLRIKAGEAAAVGCWVGQGWVGVGSVGRNVEISAIQRIDFLPTDIVLTTTPELFFDYQLLLRGKTDVEKRSNLIAPNGTCAAVDSKFSPDCFPFNCHINFNNPAAVTNIANLFYVAPVFDMQSGLYSCRVRVLSKPSQSSSILNEDVVITAETLDGLVQTRPFLVRFLPGLFVQQNHLKVSYGRRFDTLIVWGIEEVFLQLKLISDNHFVTITVTDSTTTSKSYKISVDRIWWTLEDPPALSVQLFSKITKQQIILPIKCTGLRLELDEYSLISWTNLIVVMVVVISILAVIKLRSIFTGRDRNANNVVVMTRESPFIRDRAVFSERSPLNSSNLSLGGSFEETPIYGSSPYSGSSLVDNSSASERIIRRRF